MLDRMKFWRTKGEPAIVMEYARLDLPEGYSPSKTRPGDSHPLVFGVVDWLALNIRQLLPVVTPANHPAAAVVTPNLLEDALAILLLEGRVHLQIQRAPTGFPELLKAIPLARLRKAREGPGYQVARVTPLAGQVMTWEPVRAQDIFRISLRGGISPLDSLTKDLLTEDESVETVNAMLKNRGLLGLVVSPAAGQPPWPPNITDQIRKDINTKTSGTNRGSTMAIGAPVQVVGHTSTGVHDALAAMRHIPEERVTAAFHVPAAVVGFGTGVEQTKVGATLVELRAIAWDDGLLPHASRLYSGLETVLMGPQGYNTPSATLTYSLRGIGVYADRWRKNALAWSGLVLSGIAGPDEAREALNLIEE